MEIYEDSSLEEILLYLSSLPEDKIRRALFTIASRIYLESEDSFKLFQFTFSHPKYYTNRSLEHLFLYTGLLDDRGYSKVQKDEVMKTLLEHIDKLELNSSSDIGHYMAQELKFYDAISIFEKFIKDGGYNKLDAAEWEIKDLIQMYQSDSYYEIEIKKLKILLKDTYKK